MTVRPRLAFIALCLGLSAATLSGVPASAQGFFDMFFGGSTERGGQYVPRQARAYSDPYNSPAPDRSYGGSSSSSSTSSGGTGRYVAYCVRLCDGRHFPMQRHSNATSIQLCSAFCPATKTQVFSGSQIDHAVAANGARYANLDNAFVYREKVVAGCTCNGKDAFGLAKIDVASDPTLRPGDIVATGDNQKAALAAAANRLARSTIPAATIGSATRTARSAASAEASDADERPED